MKFKKVEYLISICYGYNSTLKIRLLPPRTFALHYGKYRTIVIIR